MMQHGKCDQADQPDNAAGRNQSGEAGFLDAGGGCTGSGKPFGRQDQGDSRSSAGEKLWWAAGKVWAKGVLLF